MRSVSELLYRELTRKRSFNMLADFLQNNLRAQQNPAEEADMGYSLNEDEQPIIRQRRRIRLHPRFFFRR
nr:hypothetical protein BaRGS_033971 [Batillaria attramentaria]